MLARLVTVATFGLALTASTAEADVFPGTETETAGNVTATLTYTAKGDGVASELVIARDGTEVLRAPAGTSACGDEPAAMCGPPGAIGGPPAESLEVVDLDGDGEPEVIVDAYSGGAHCCTFSEISRWTGSGYVTKSRNWADDGYRLDNTSGDASPEFVTGDSRFTYRFEAYAFSGRPVRILAYAAGKFTDVTRQNLALVRTDAADQWASFRKVRRDKLGRGFAAAWAADQYRLGKRPAALRTLRSEARKGRLGALYDRTTAASFIKMLDRLLKSWGYAPG
ncbi:MAG: hypothetical protein V9E83_11380 [Baekduia sp.]